MDKPFRDRSPYLTKSKKKEHQAITPSKAKKETVKISKAEKENITSSEKKQNHPNEIEPFRTITEEKQKLREYEENLYYLE